MKGMGIFWNRSGAGIFEITTGIRFENADGAWELAILSKRRPLRKGLLTQFANCHEGLVFFLGKIPGGEILLEP